MERDHLRQEALALVGLSRQRRRCRGPLEQFRALPGIVRDGEGLLEEVRRLTVRRECRGPFSRRAQGDSGLGGQGIGLVAAGSVGMGGQVVAGQGPGQLITAQALEIARGREVAGLPIALGQGVIGDFADQPLDEGVLTPVRAARVGLDGQDLAPDQRSEAGRELVLRLAADRRS